VHKLVLGPATAGCNEVLDECHEASSGCISEVYLVSWEDTPVNKFGAFWYSLAIVWYMFVAHP